MAVAIRIKQGIIERLRETRGISSEDAFARLINSERTTLRRIAAGAQPSGSFIANFCSAFGLGLGEAFEIVSVESATTSVNPSASSGEAAA